MAKCYYRQKNLKAAYRSILAAMHIDSRDIGTKILATKLAHKFYLTAHRRHSAGQHHQAIANYQKVLKLKPSSIVSWIEMGKSYDTLGFPLEARSSWREALKVNPENKTVYALLDIDFKPGAATQLAVRPDQIDQLANPSAKVPASVADDSLNIVRNNTTKKGTKIESALESVITLTKSLGTPVIERGWKVKKEGAQFLVAYVCEQSKGVLETFEWVVDVDSKRVNAHNANARLLMGRW